MCFRKNKKKDDKFGPTYPERASETNRKRRPRMGRVYAGPEMKCVYAGPEEFRRKNAMNDVYAGPVDQNDLDWMSGVYAGPPISDEPNSEMPNQSMIMMVYAGPDVMDGGRRINLENTEKPSDQENAGETIQCVCGAFVAQNRKFCDQCGAPVKKIETSEQ